MCAYKLFSLGDYEQCSDDDGDPVLQDPKGMTLQEVELMTACTSEDNLTSIHEPVQVKFIQKNIFSIF